MTCIYSLNLCVRGRCVSPITQVLGIKPRSLGLGSKHLYPLSQPFCVSCPGPECLTSKSRGSAAGWGSHRRGNRQQVIWVLRPHTSPPQVLICPHQLPLANGRKVLSRQSTGAGILMTIIAVIAVIKLRGLKTTLIKTGFLLDVPRRYPQSPLGRVSIFLSHWSPK